MRVSALLLPQARSAYLKPEFEQEAPVKSRVYVTAHSAGCETLLTKAEA